MKRFLIVATLLAASVFAYAQKTAVSYEAVAVSSTAIGLAALTISPSTGELPTECYGRVETNDIRYRCDGTNPTTTNGVLVQANETIKIYGRGNMVNIKFIATGSDATLRLHCYE